MTDTPHLGLPFIEGGQAQKHVTHNEALRILDAAIQIAVQDTTRTMPPAGPAEGQRHVVAAGAGGAWAGQALVIATWQDGAWAFLAPQTGWCIWSVADDAMRVFDGAAWRDMRSLALDNASHLGVNTSADSTNRLSVKSDAALFAAIPVAEGGSGNVRLQLSKESAAKTASVVFSDNYSGRAEFGLVGSDAFKLKVSADGVGFVEALAIDQSTGNATLPRGVALSGVIAPATLTANQNDYSPSGLAAASVLQIAADAARSLSGLGGGAEGRILVVVNVGSQPVTLLDDSAASLAVNRFSFGGNLTLAARQAALLRYDATAARWQALAGGLSLRADAAQALSAAQQAQGRANLAISGRNLLINGDFRINLRVYASAAVLAAGKYGHDRWKAGAAGGDYAFTQLKSSTQVTIAAGKTLIQVVEDVHVGSGGAYVLSWTGSCLGRVGVNSATPSGAYAASPILITGQNAGTTMSVEFGNGASSGTLGTVQLEAGTVASPFESTGFAAEQAKCLRYYTKSYADAVAPGSTATGTFAAFQAYGIGGESAGSYSFGARMRAAPTVTFYSPNSGATGQLYNATAAADTASGGPNSVSPLGFSGANGGRTVNNVYRFEWTAEAEL